MTAVSRLRNQGFFAILAMTTLFFLAGIVLLPTLCSDADQVKAQNHFATKDLQVPERGRR